MNIIITSKRLTVLVQFRDVCEMVCSTVFRTHNNSYLLAMDNSLRVEHGYYFKDEA